MFGYRVFGLNVASQVRLPFPASPAVDGRPPDLEILLDPPAVLPEQPPSDMKKVEVASADPTEEEAIVLFRGRNGYLLRFGTIVDFVLDYAGTTIRCQPALGIILPQIWLGLLSQAFAFMVHLRGLLGIHGSAVLVGERAISFLGLPGAGKSTTAMHFLRGGYRFLTDDLLPVEVTPGQVTVRPAFPSLKLMEDTSSFFFGKDRQFPPILPIHPKRRIASPEVLSGFVDKSMPLSALFWLEHLPETDGFRTSPHVDIRRLTGSSALFALLRSVYSFPLFDSKTKARYLTLCNVLGEAVPVYEVTSQGGLSALPLIQDTIERTVRR